MIFFLFGPAGVGKNYVAETLATHFGYHFWDADEALPLDMQTYIACKQVFTQEMRDRFTQIIISNTETLAEKYPHLIVTQALYKERNRLQLAEAFPGAQFILIKTKLENIIRRLKKRDNLVDQIYAEKIQSQFEEPLLPHNSIINNADQAEIIKQFQILFKEV
jgi:gluconate kinase